MDFETEVIRGHVDFDVIRLVSEAEFFILDTAHDLEIRDVLIADSGQKLDVDRTISHEVSWGAASFTNVILLNALRSLFYQLQHLWN